MNKNNTEREKFNLEFSYVGETLRQFRKSDKRPIKVIAYESKLCASTIIKYENTANIHSIEKFYTLCDVYGFEVCDIIKHGAKAKPKKHKGVMFKNYKDFENHIWTKLIDEREKRWWSIRKVAELSLVSRAAIQTYESRKTKPGLFQIYVIGNSLDFDLYDLLRRK